MTTDADPLPGSDGMPTFEPQDAHRWLAQALGDWTVTIAMPMPDGSQAPPSHARETVRAMGPFWIVTDGHADLPDGGALKSSLTLGYDPLQGCFVGTFVASMMPILWTYRGTLDAAGRTLTLEADGPDFSRPGATTRYQDIYTLESPDHRRLTTLMLMADGSWMTVMTADYRRA